MAALNQVKEENRVLIDSLSKINSSELISILQEVFRLKQIEDDEEVTRWFLVSHTSIFDKEKGFFKPEDRLDALHIAQPLHPSNEDDFFQIGGCPSCGLHVLCPEKLAVCPYCGEIVMCT